MSITVIAEVWHALKIEIGEGNLSDAAESLISVLVDNDYEPSEIKDAFRGETVVMDALREYNASFQDEDEEDQDEYEEEEWD